MNARQLCFSDIPYVILFLVLEVLSIDNESFNTSTQHQLSSQSHPGPRSTHQHHELIPNTPIYTEDQFIPPPRWSPVHAPLMFNSTEELINFRDRLSKVNNQLINVTYNSANSLIRLYNDYKKVEHKYNRDLGRFYMDYQPLVHEDHNNCVGLIIALRKRCIEELQKDYPNIDEHFFYSAGEMKLAPNNDLLTSDSLRGDEKWKHVALALHFTIGDRPGYFFIDQSFGVPVVTLMQDTEHPHQGKFFVPYKYNRDDHLYSLSDNGFINFTRYCIDFLSTDSRQATGAFYLRRAYGSILDITEKRALVKTKRCITVRLPSMKRPMDVDVLLQNGTKMEIYKAGKYFPQYMAGTIDLSTTNLSDPDLGLDIDLRLKVGSWGNGLGFPMFGFLYLIGNLSRIAQDKHFLHQLRHLDHVINNHTAKYMTSAEYEDPGLTAGHDILYDNFVSYIHTLTSKEVIDMWKTYREMNPNKDGRTMVNFPWTDDATFCCPNSNGSHRHPLNESEQFVTRDFRAQYQIPDMDI